jgi:hypothetical protein
MRLAKCAQKKGHKPDVLREGRVPLGYGLQLADEINSEFAPNLLFALFKS